LRLQVKKRQVTTPQRDVAVAHCVLQGKGPVRQRSISADLILVLLSRKEQKASAALAGQETCEGLASQTPNVNKLPNPQFHPFQKPHLYINSNQTPVSLKIFQR